MMSNSKYLYHPSGKLKGSIHLHGSKSISNRVLIIKALCKGEFAISNISESDDTTTLQQLLDSEEIILNAHHAGTTYRFLTAFLAVTTEKEIILTGSSRMQERPIGPLVEALNKVGADISYVNQSGFPPLTISPMQRGSENSISIKGDVSSQYISALLLVAPTLKNGLKIKIVGELVSRPYIEMTLSIMSYFGVSHTWCDNAIEVAAQSYVSRDIFIEGDWSSASYFYSMAALSSSCHVEISGLNEDSLQADRAIADIARSYGVETDFSERSIVLRKVPMLEKKCLEYNFINCPDITQTMAVMCAGLNIKAVFTGLKTLKIKETNRIEALRNELKKFNVNLTLVEDDQVDETYTIDGAFIPISVPVAIKTYDDHRMAMSFVALSLITPISIENPEVVSKSYPRFWTDLEELLS